MNSPTEKKENFRKKLLAGQKKKTRFKTERERSPFKKKIILQEGETRQEGEKRCSEERVSPASKKSHTVKKFTLQKIKSTPSRKRQQGGR